jgi:hypothetical protein
MSSDVEDQPVHDSGSDRLRERCVRSQAGVRPPPCWAGRLPRSPRGCRLPYHSSGRCSAACRSDCTDLARRVCGFRHLLMGGVSSSFEAALTIATTRMAHALGQVWLSGYLRPADQRGIRKRAGEALRAHVALGASPLQIRLCGHSGSDLISAASSRGRQVPRSQSGLLIAARAELLFLRRSAAP